MFLHAAAFTKGMKFKEELLDRVLGIRSVKLIGMELKKAHDKYGGFTEAIAVVWSAKSQPQVLELMPPNYKPVPRSGVIGIGNLNVLQWVKDNFEIGVSPLGLEAIGYPFELAGMHLVAEFAEGVRAVGKGAGATVQLPIQYMLITQGKLHNRFMVMSPDGEAWTPFTADPKDLKLPPMQTPVTVERHQANRSATQVFL